MDHEAYERNMFDSINQHAAEDKKKPKTFVDNKAVVRAVLIRGLKRTLLALLTIATFALAVIGLIAVAFVKGYLAVLLFFISIVALVCSYTLLCAQGITDKLFSESKGENTNG